jgi:CBS domain-containing protein
MQARNIMTPNPSVVTRDATVARAAALMRDRHIDMLPVVDDLRTRHLVGVLTDRDIVVRCVAGQLDVGRPVAELMTARPLAIVHVDSKPEEVIGLMNRSRLRRIPVLDDKERLVGVIARADLSRRARSPDARSLDGTQAPASDAGEAAMR